MATLRQINQELKDQNHHLRVENIKMRLELEVLMDFPTGKAAEKILNKYRRKRAIREAALKSMSNENN